MYYILLLIFLSIQFAKIGNKMNNLMMLLSFFIVLVSSYVGAIVSSDGSSSWRLSHSEDFGVHNVKGVQGIYNRLLSAARSIRGGESHGKVIELANIDMFNTILEDSGNANKVIILIYRYDVFLIMSNSSFII